MKYILLATLLMFSSVSVAQTVDTYRLSREGANLSDTEIQKIVEDQVAEKMEGSAAKVTVAVKNGHVIFGGSVETGSQLYVLHSLAQKIDGVKSFENNAEVK